MLQHIALKARIPSFTTEKLHRFKFYQNWCRTTSICARQPQSVQGNLNLCRATSICAKQPQSVQNNLNSCKTTSIRAEKKAWVQKSILSPWNRPLLFGFFFCARIEVVLHELRLFCTDWGCFAQIEVALHRLRLPCTDWGCLAPIEVAMNSLKEDITLSILRALSTFVVESEI